MSRRGRGPGGKSILSQAFEAHRAGDLRRAEKLYRRALKSEPRNPDAHHLHGLLAHHQGEHATAAARMAKALVLNPGDLPCRNHRAEALAADGRPQEAEAELRSVLDAQANSPETLNNLANVLAVTGRIDEAVETYRMAIALAPDFAEAHGNLGVSLARTGDLAGAQAACERALELNSDHHLFQAALGNVFAEQGRTGDAIMHYERALTLNAKAHVARVELAVCLASVGRLSEAAAHMETALRTAGEQYAIHAGLARILKEARPSAFDPNLESLALRALASDLVQPEEVARVAGLLLRLKYGLNASTKHDLDAAMLAQMASDKLLQATLKRCVNTDPVLEGALVGLRRRLFEAEIFDLGVANAMPLAASLAQQCFLNEYVYEENAEEAAAADGLERAITTRAEEEGFPSNADGAMLVRYALYRPLSALPCDEQLVGVPEDVWPDELKPLIRAQILDAIEEREIGAKLSTIGAIEDAVSLKVAAQYEDNPYPRWGAAGRPGLESAASIFAGLFPHQTIPAPLTGSLDILVAGCGTGRHPIASVALRYAECDVLGIDLSRASLAYAARKAKLMEADNITFARADILALGALDRRFGLIECAGVLHHMADPEAGWRVLRDLLLPGGVMVIGLYSERARATITRARAHIAELGLEGSIEGIRAYRRRLLAGEEKGLETLLTWPDFYSISGCRDLLFHVQEHLFTLPRIKTILSALDLEFLGFENDSPGFWQRYREFAPEDVSATDLDAWDRLEEAHPETFGGMYQFWCRRTDG